VELCLTIEPLERAGLRRRDIIDALAKGLDASRQVAALRLERALSSSTESLRRDVLVHLFRMADDRSIPWWLLLNRETGSLFDLLPHERTLTYLGAYGTAEGEELKYSETITASVSDYRAARYLARRITRDYSRLRFAPSIGGTYEQITRTVEKLAQQWTEDENGSILSIGSTKTNTMSEWLVARALDLKPFRRGSKGTRKLPVEFRYIISQEQHLTLYKKNPERCNGSIDVPPDAPEGPPKHSFLEWRGDRHSYQPPAERPEKPTPEGGDGKDYAVVVIDGRSMTKANVVIAGLTGAGTLGASMLMCHEPHLFEQPPRMPDVRLFLVEVKLKREETLRRPYQARVLEHWTKSSEKYERIAETVWSGLGILSAGMEPGDLVPTTKNDNTNYLRTHALELYRKYPGKYLVIYGRAVRHVLDSPDAITGVVDALSAEQRAELVIQHIPAGAILDPTGFFSRGD